MLEINRIYQGNCLELMKSIDDNSVDAVVTDPPYELGFMGKSWDSTGIANDINLWIEALRVLKPGGYLLSFGGSRTYHRMACAIEDAGFKIRDMIEWIYGSGFPKSLDISKAVDKMAGVEREIIGKSNRHNSIAQSNIINPQGRGGIPDITAPSTPSAIQWQGWGTALKPAHEPICMARKPLECKTVAENVLKYGTGGINIDECRVGTDNTYHYDRKGGKPIYEGGENIEISANNHPSGRFPANLIHDGSEVVMAEFEKYGILKSGGMSGKRYINKTSKENWNVNFGADIGKETGINISDSGTPARFFYCAKVSKSERDMGCEGLEEKVKKENMLNSKWNNDPRSSIGYENKIEIRAKNNHPTVKPIKLMEYLIKLVTTEKAIVLDPFAGSGSTLIACRNLGRNYIGIEKEADYVEIANKRIVDFKQQLVLA